MRCFAMLIAAAEMSSQDHLRPDFSAARAVEPIPAKGSTTCSPSSVSRRMK